MPPTGKWPKVLPPLTPEQQRRSDEFMKLWHEVLPRRYGLVERFNHLFPVRHSPPGFRTTLELGAGLGEHLAYERLTPEQEANYHCNEFRANMAAEIRRRFPRVQTVVGDCQQRLDFPDGHFDRVLAVHVLEHLPNLPATLREAHRLLHPTRGRFLIVIPTEGSPAYSLARRISAQRVWNRRFGGGYEEFYRREHINLPHEIFEELAPWFTIEARSFFPLGLPWVFCNLCIGLALRPRAR
ncbi:MAG TPA: class I SAM-dependent methyltransferase [Opitutaceae bacterium]|nr:class I SAM-dependent methyltransferase [Opitutaceae bacterium]HND60510.1 class I SAM-dependent methyltransferase [Opitutaceae bacterium]